MTYCGTSRPSGQAWRYVSTPCRCLPCMSAVGPGAVADFRKDETRLTGKCSKSVYGASRTYPRRQQPGVRHGGQRLVDQLQLQHWLHAEWQLVAAVHYGHAGRHCSNLQRCVPYWNASSPSSSSFDRHLLHQTTWFDAKIVGVLSKTSQLGFLRPSHGVPVLQRIRARCLLPRPIAPATLRPARWPAARRSAILAMRVTS